MRIKTSVLDLELPLLLSKGALKRAKAVLDFENNTPKFAGETLNLRETSAGHYALPPCNRKRMTSGPDSPGNCCESNTCEMDFDIWYTEQVHGG